MSIFLLASRRRLHDGHDQPLTCSGFVYSWKQSYTEAEGVHRQHSTGYLT